MKRFSGTIGVEQGTRLLFSDFADDGAMWSGQGPREVRHAQPFKEAFADVPVVMVGVSMWDMDQKTNFRADITAENITTTGFDIVFRTWADTRIARIRAEWTAIGPAQDEDNWEVA